MATKYFVDGAKADDTGDGLSWANAKKTIDAALTLATGTGDSVIIKYNALSTTDSEVGAAKTYTFGGNIFLISASADDTGTAFTPTAMGTSYWIGNSTASRNVNFNGSFSCYIYGITIRTASSGTANISLNSNGTDSGSFIYDSCYIWQGGSATTGTITCGSATATTNETATRLVNCTIRFGHVSQTFGARHKLQIIGGSLSSAGSIPTTLFNGTGIGTNAEVIGVDLSQETGTLVADQTSGFKKFTFAQCKFGAGVTPMAAQTTNPNESGCEVFVLDCASGDTHYVFEHYNAFGTLTTDNGVYVTADGAAYDTVPNRMSWKIVTTGNAAFHSPYISPWIPVYHSGTSAITPFLEGVVTTTAPKDDEIWSEWLFKGTSGFTTGTFDQTDRRTLQGTAASQTASSLTASDWTGEPASPQFFKLAPGSSITPAEIGDLGARVCVGKASTTYYIDPQIRGRS